MDFFDVVKTRRSVRFYNSTPVEAEKLQQILEVANRAPSAGNLQAYEIYIVTSRERRNALAQAAFGQRFVADAPLALVFCTHPARSVGRYGDRGTRLYALQDATIACTMAMLAATNLGLGTVWVGAFNDGQVSQVIGDPKGLHPVAILSIGYAADEPSAVSPRRPLNELVHGEW